ncbi:MAG TPA: hypothetical protein VG900_07035 [Hyphomicrobiaceae bacterium]|jgi:hypothetical protein|nr:hypothetical protein [Hyphomicrobiaceae bacterium]
MRSVRTITMTALALAFVALGTSHAPAQPAGLNPQKDCQTIRTCRFERGGPYRGCLSSYSCRVCRFVTARCHIDVGRRVCQRMVCSWG